jgi:hypothetical protein
MINPGRRPGGTLITKKKEREISWNASKRQREEKQVGLRTGATTQILDHPGIDSPRDYIFGGNLWYLLLALGGVFGQMNP